ncbi:MAG: hypothetical protein ACK40G_11870 [Cytophagaceae bacterium]
MNYKIFYQELGKLLYAIAFSDKKITASEKESLRKLVKEQVLPLEASKDKYGTDLGFLTEFEFDLLEERKADPGSTFDDFIGYMKENKTGIPAALKNLAYDLASKVAESYRGINQNEKELLNKLKQVIA